MKYLITALLLVSLQAQSAPDDDKAIFTKCSALAEKAKLTVNQDIFIAAAIILGATIENSKYNWGFAYGFAAGSKKSASQIYYSICKEREQYAKDLIAQTKT